MDTFNEVAETIILKAFFENSEVLDKYYLNLNKDMFVNINNKKIFEVMADLHRQNIFNKQNILTGAAKELTELLKNSVHITADTEINYQVNAVIECYKKRLMLELQASGMGTKEIIKKLDNIDIVTDFDESGNIGELSREYREQFNTVGEEKPIKTSLPAFDDKIGGLFKSELTIIAGSTSSGKTASALQIARHLINNDIPVLIFSLEMNADTVFKRLLSHNSGVTTQQRRTTDLTDTQKKQINEEIDVLEHYEKYLYIKTTRSLNKIISVSEAFTKKTEGKGLIIIDYLQLIQTNGKQERRIDISNISREVKYLTTKHKIPIIMLSQLKRPPAHEQNHIPKLSDLMESASIEQDANNVIFLYCTNIKDGYPVKDEKTGIIDISLIVAKNRNGTRGTVKTAFNTRTQLLDYKYPEDRPIQDKNTFFDELQDARASHRALNDR